MSTIKLKIGTTLTTIGGTDIKKKPARRGRPPAKERKYEEEAGAFSVEEHCILRMPSDDDLTTKFREIVKKRREYPADMEIEWKDSRRGLFKFDGQVLFARLVDLPCIIETQRTFDRRSFIKTGDVSQMIIIERIPEPSAHIPDPISQFFSKPLTTDVFIANSGITPPLKYCRQRRFRKRLNKRTLESIEREVARLLKEDQRAEKVETKFVDPSELDARLAAGADEEDEIINVEEYDDEDDASNIRGNSEDEESDVDSELAAELEDEIAKAFESDEEEEEEEEEEQEVDENDEIQEGYEEEEEEMDSGLRILLEQQKILREEMKDLEEKIGEKTDQKSKAVNPIIQKRFDDIIKKLESERELKHSQMNELEIKIEDSRQAAEELAAEKDAELQQQAEQSAGN